jgi:thioredoxin reductase/SAM-dependent methyltransferase
MEHDTWDTIIIGAGPAGLAAALMLGRARRRPLVVDAGAPRNRFAEHMHGVVGFEGATPEQLRARGRAEAEEYGVEFLEARVERVRDEVHRLAVVVDDGRELVGRTLVLASGVTDELPPVPGLAERWGARVLHCPYCHGWEVRDGRLGVFVTGPQSLHQAQLVRQWSERVTVFAGGAIDAEGRELVPPTPLPDDVAERLRVRGVSVETEAVRELAEAGGTGELEPPGELGVAVRLRDGREIAVDAIFTGGTLRPHDGMLADLRLERETTPAGSVIKTGMGGVTSHPRVFAAGNVVAPHGNVPLSLGAGSMAGAIANWQLVEDDTAAALRGEEWPEVAPADYWSGRVNAVLADVAAGLAPGTALDLGCGEGGDVLWLAERGWRAVGVDISATAVERARAEAKARELDGATFVSGDLGEVLRGEVLPDEALPDEAYSLVTASFLHSPVALARGDILRLAAERVARGGHLLVTTHAAPPPWSGHAQHAGDGAEAAGPTAHRFLTPEEELAELGLDEAEWEPIIVESRSRESVGPTGEPATLDDGVVLVRRR